MSGQAYKPMLINTAIPYRPTHNLFTQSKSPVVMHHEQWRRHLGTADVSVPNVGHILVGTGVWRKPVFIMSDPLAFTTDAAGNPKPGGGLMSTSALEYKLFVSLFRFAYQSRSFTIVPIDEHTDEQKMLNPEAITNIALTNDLFEQLTPKHQANAQRWFADKIEIPGIRDAQYLTVAEANALFGPYTDGEFRDFLFPMVHCVEGIAEWTKEIGEIFGEIKTYNKAAVVNGETAPVNRVFPVHKTGLFGNVAPNIRGLYGNNYDALLQASQYGCPQGPAYDFERRAVVAGMGTPYSAFNEVLHALDNGFTVTLLVAATFHFEPCGLTKFEVIRQLRMSYPFGLRAYYYWPENELGGPEPSGFNRLAKEVRDQDKAALAQARLTISNTFNAFGGDQMKVIEDWD